MKKLLSIIIPCFNMERYLPRCLDSLGMDEPAVREALDVVVVNDGSKDRSIEIAHEFEARYPTTITVIDKENGHYGSCINAALKVICGEFVKVLEPDDVYCTKDFASFVTELGHMAEDGGCQSVDLLVTDYASINAEGKISKIVHYDYPSREVMSFETFQAPLKYHILLPAVTYRTSVVRASDYCQTEGCPYTDLEWLTYPMSQVRNAYYLPYSIYRYFIGREDQSINPGVLKRGVSIIVKLMRRMLGDYSTLTDAVRPGVKEYVNKVIATQLGLIYRSLLLEQNPYLQIEDVVSLDDLVRKVSPEMVRRTDLAVHSHFFDFHYVREFRRARTRQTFKFALFDFYVKLRKRVALVLR